MNLGICALCDEERAIIDSHLIPSWAYTRLRTKKANPHPIAVVDNNATYLNKEIKFPLLCEECDGERFGRIESGIARLFDINGWPQSKIKRTSPVEEIFIFDDDVDIEQLKYFAISVIWRSHAMKSGVNLGLYAKPMKEYLMGRSAFPAHVSIGITILEPDLRFPEKCSFFSLPTSSKDHNAWMHGFHFFGLLFKIFVGKMLSPELKILNTFTDQGGVFVKQISQTVDFNILVDVAKSATARGKLHRDNAA